MVGVLNEYKILLYYLIVYVSTLFPVKASEQQPEFGCRWYKNLNFQIQDVKDTFISTNTIIRLERKGNKTEEVVYDIKTIHSELSKKHKDPQDEKRGLVQDHNLVTAGISLFVKEGTSEVKYRAVFEPIDTLYLSGHSEKERQKNFNEMNVETSKELVKNFEERFDKSTQIKETLSYDKIENAMLVWKEKVKSQTISIKREDGNPAELSSKIRDSLRDIYYGHYDHSEQYLIKDLKRTLEEGYSALRGYYQTLYTSYINKRKQQVRILSNLQDFLDGKNTKEQFIESTNQIINEKTNLDNCKRLGLILHLHSKYDICATCASSITQECLLGQTQAGHFIYELLETMKKHNQDSEYQPFFAVLASSNEPIPAGELGKKVEDGLPDDRRNIGFDATWETEEEPILLNTMAQSGFFAQAIIGGDASQLHFDRTLKRPLPTFAEVAERVKKMKSQEK